MTSENESYKDRRLFSLNDIISLGGTVAGAILSALRTKYPLIKMKDIEPGYVGEDTIWNALALENAKKYSHTNTYDPKSYRDGQNIDSDFGTNTLYEIDYIKEPEGSDEGSDGVYLIRNTKTGDIEDYEEWENVDKRFMETYGMVATWIGSGEPPPSNIVWADGFDDKE